METELHLISPKPREFRIDTTTPENFIVSVIIPGFPQPVAMTKDELAKLVAHSVQQIQAAQQREQFLVKGEETPGGKGNLVVVKPPDDENICLDPCSEDPKWWIENNALHIRRKSISSGIARTEHPASTPLDEIEAMIFPTKLDDKGRAVIQNWKRRNEVSK